MNQGVIAGDRPRGGPYLAGTDAARLVDQTLVSVMACFAGLLVGGAPGLALTSVGTLLVTWVVLHAGAALLPTSICFRTVVYIYGSQTLVQLLLALTGATICPTGGWGVNLVEHSGTLAIGELSLLAGTVLAAWAWGRMAPGRSAQSIDLKKRLPAKAGLALVIALLLHISQPIIGLVVPESVGWGLSVLLEDLEAAAFFVGWYVEDIGPLANKVALIVLIVNCAVGGLRGTRYPILLLALYLIGRVSSPRERNRRAIAYASLAAAVPMIFVFSMIGEVRAITGHASGEVKQESLQLLAPSRWGDVLQAALAMHEYQGKDADNTGNTVRRLFAWPNAASMILTPDPIPYRGFAQWLAECRWYFKIGTWSSEGRDQFAQEGYGTSHASDYGFLNIRGSTVEFGILADGWSTAGPVGVLIMGFLVMLVLCMSEHLVLYRINLSAVGKLVFLCILMKACIQCYVYPAPMVIRYIVLYTCFWVFVLKVVDFLSGESHEALGSKKKRSTRPALKATSGYAGSPLQKAE